MRLVGHIRLNSLFQVRSPRCATRNFPNVMMLPTDWAFSVVSTSCGLKVAQYGFGLPAPGAPGSDVLITSPAALTTRQSRPAIAILSPGFATMCFALPYSDG